MLSLRPTAIVAEELYEIDGNINVVVDIHCFTSSGLNAHLNSVKIAVAICASLTVIFLKYEIEKRLRAV